MSPHYHDVVLCSWGKGRPRGKSHKWSHADWLDGDCHIVLGLPTLKGFSFSQNPFKAGDESIFGVSNRFRRGGGGDRSTAPKEKRTYSDCT